MKKMNITVFSGLSKDNTSAGLSHCRRIGEIIVEKGYTMVCAGASLGCQNELIEGALSKKQESVIAVTVPMFAHELKPQLKSKAIIAEGKDLSERKKIMKDKATYGYIILPGGPGTLDELWEIIAEKAENINDGGKKHIIIVNTEGFYEPVKQQLAIMEETFKWTYSTGITFIDDPEELNTILEPATAAAPTTSGSSRKRRSGKGRTRKLQKRTRRM